MEVERQVRGEVLVRQVMEFRPQCLTRLARYRGPRIGRLKQVPVGNVALLGQLRWKQWLTGRGYLSLRRLLTGDAQAFLFQCLAQPDSPLPHAPYGGSHGDCNSLLLSSE